MPAREQKRFERAEMFDLAAGAVRRVDREGLRGITRVSTEEIAAMAGALVALGLCLNRPSPSEGAGDSTEGSQS